MREIRIRTVRQTFKIEKVNGEVEYQVKVVGYLPMYYEKGRQLEWCPDIIQPHVDFTKYTSVWHAIQDNSNGIANLTEEQARKMVEDFGAEKKGDNYVVQEVG